MIPLIWISTVVWVLLLVISVVQISKRKLLDAGWLRANLLVLIAYSITVAVATQTAGNALWFAIFGEPYPGESLESLRFASLLGALVMISVTLVAVWDSLRTVGRDNQKVPTTQKKGNAQEHPSPKQTQAQQQVQIVLGVDELRRILNRIETDRRGLEELERKSQGELEQLAQELNQIRASIHELNTKYGPTWDSALRGQLMVVHDQLRNSGSAMTRRDYGKARDDFETSYQVAMQLRYYLESKSKGQRTTMIRGVEELLPTLREWMARWEQYERLDNQQRWQMASQGEIQRLAKELSSRLVSLDSEYAESWDDGMRNQVQIVSSDLQKLGLRQLTILAGDKALQGMEDLGKSAYEKSRALVSFLATR
ncbi:hypothetical protein MUP79_08455 [Candidatus Bathyarchaeota archaeon]|nr:hypothetical protein [Candidatus Bathyarchaeota archaeon]